MSVGSSLFFKCFSLVNFDPARVLFLNNMNEEVQRSAVDVRICKKNNIEMARKVIKVVHETMNKKPISISSVVSQAIKTKLKLEERLRIEEDEEIRRMLGKLESRSLTLKFLHRFL